jgi:hypothetical protein
MGQADAAYIVWLTALILISGTTLHPIYSV